MLEDNENIRLLKFFMWFRTNGEKYVCHPIEDMIKIYLDEKYNSEK